MPQQDKPTFIVRDEAADALSIGEQEAVYWDLVHNQHAQVQGLAGGGKTSLHAQVESRSERNAHHG